MRKSEKLRVLSALVALGGALLFGGLGHAASDTFEGTWYASYAGVSLRIELRLEGDQLVGSANMLIPGQGSLPFLVRKAEQVGETLSLVLSGQGPPGMPEEIKIELRVPKNELVGEISLGQGTQGQQGIPLVMTQDAPELAARFADVKPLSPEEMKELTARSSGAALRSSCANNLKQLGIVMKMFANESRGERYPRPDGLKLFREDIYPEYLSDLNVLMCPADDVAPEEGMPEADKTQWYLENSRYWYIGHAVNTEEHGLAYVEAYRKVVQEGDGNLDIDFDAPSLDHGKVFRMREGIDRFIITDINNPRASALAPSTIPVLVERPGTHQPDGGNVLFLDGHVEYIKYPGKFPMTEVFIEGLRSLDPTTESS